MINLNIEKLIQSLWNEVASSRKIGDQYYTHFHRSAKARYEALGGLYGSKIATDRRTLFPQPASRYQHHNPRMVAVPIDLGLADTVLTVLTELRVNRPELRVNRRRMVSSEELAPYLRKP